MAAQTERVTNWAPDQSEHDVSLILRGYEQAPDEHDYELDSERDVDREDEDDEDEV